MTKIMELWHEESLCMDPERLAGIYVEMGESRAKTVIAGATEELALEMERLKGLMLAGHPRAMPQTARRLRDIAEPLGLCSLTQVAEDLAKTAATENRVAMAAILARLDRLANQSLKMVWDLQDMSG